VTRPVPPQTLETARLRLRLPTPADIAAIFEYASDPEVTRLMDWPRATDALSAHEFVSRTLMNWEAATEYTWVIAGLSDDRVIGAVSLRLRETDADFGYVLRRDAWGHGFAPEAALGAIDWLARARYVPRLWATCDVENIRSARVLEKLGLGREKVLTGNAVRPNISQVPRDSFLYSKALATEGG
jgi:RimJ/RimL family protein N-acetyltransferase